MTFEAEIENLLDYVRWVLDEKIPDCDYCEAKFWRFLQMKHGDEDRPPCFDCEMPDLFPENSIAWRVFTVCSSQMRVVGMGTPLGLEFSAIDRAMEHCGVHELDRPLIFEKVRRCGEEYASMCRKAQDTERKASQNKRGERQSTRSAVMYPPGVLKNKTDKGPRDSGLFKR